MAREEANDILKNERDSGVFLVRESQTQIGSLVLCVKWVLYSWIIQLLLFLGFLWFPRSWLMRWNSGGCNFVLTLKFKLIDLFELIVQAILFSSWTRRVYFGIHYFY